MGNITLTRDGAIARISIDNPARYNAMSMSMWTALGDAVAAIDQDPDVRVVLLRGTGEKAFVSGADISEFDAQRSSADGATAYNNAVHRAETGLANCSKPVVACIHGVCMGGGIGLALACDLRYAAKNARFRMPAGRLGLGYAFEGMQRWIDVIGAPRTAEIFYTARSFDGSEAERISLVHQAYDSADLDAKVEEVLQQIAINAPLTIHAAKIAIGQALLNPEARDMASVGQAIKACFDSGDYAEGRRAFAEKRVPVFTGK